MRHLSHQIVEIQCGCFDAITTGKQCAAERSRDTEINNAASLKKTLGTRSLQKTTGCLSPPSPPFEYKTEA